MQKIAGALKSKIFVVNAEFGTASRAAAYTLSSRNLRDWQNGLRPSRRDKDLFC